MILQDVSKIPFQCVCVLTKMIIPLLSSYYITCFKKIFFYIFYRTRTTFLSFYIWISPTEEFTIFWKLGEIMEEFPSSYTFIIPRKSKKKLGTRTMQHFKSEYPKYICLSENPVQYLICSIGAIFIFLCISKHWLDSISMLKIEIRLFQLGNDGKFCYFRKINIRCLTKLKEKKLVCFTTFF